MMMDGIDKCTVASGYSGPNKIHEVEVEQWETEPFHHRENAGTLGWYPLYKVYMGLIIKGTSQGYHHFPNDFNKGSTHPW